MIVCAIHGSSSDVVCREGTHPHTAVQHVVKVTEIRTRRVTVLAETEQQATEAALGYPLLEWVPWDSVSEANVVGRS